MAGRCHHRYREKRHYGRFRINGTIPSQYRPSSAVRVAVVVVEDFQCRHPYLVGVGVVSDLWECLPWIVFWIVGLVVSVSMVPMDGNQGMEERVVLSITITTTTIIMLFHHQHCRIVPLTIHTHPPEVVDGHHVVLVVVVGVLTEAVVEVEESVVTTTYNAIARLVVHPCRPRHYHHRCWVLCSPNIV